MQLIMEAGSVNISAYCIRVYNISIFSELTKKNF